jgi:uncharacterized protein YjbI with pentapeptide repeats
MTSPDEPDPLRVAAEIFANLSAASPLERAEIAVRWLEAHPEGRLELPAGEGFHAVLDGVDFGGISPPGADVEGSSGLLWWDYDGRRIRLTGANLRGASLRKANLGGLDLAKASLHGASLGNAYLVGAKLDGADLSDADLAGANLEAASLGDANLDGAMLEETVLRKAVLRYTELGSAALEDADLREADLWGACLEDAVLTNADLRGARLVEARCAGADLKGARLGDAILRQADFQAARLEGADLRGAIVAGANFHDAILKDARLEDVDLSRCVLLHVHLNGARLQGARFERAQLGSAIGEELAGKYEEARRAYLVLERAFTDLGDPDAASWAYRRRRRMQKLENLRQARTARDQKRPREAAAAFARYAGDQLVEWVCDYGESIPRVLASLGVLYLVFTFIYAVTDSVVSETEGPNGPIRKATHDPIDLAIFSLLAMTTGSIGVHLLPGHNLALMLVGGHVFLGIALIGLLGFVLGNRIRR